MSSPVSLADEIAGHIDLAHALTRADRARSAAERALASAETRVQEIDLRVHKLLCSLFVAWRGWVFTRPRGLEVWLANYTPEAAEALHRRGFNPVTIHDHQASRFLTCTCFVSERSDVTIVNESPPDVR